jgi:hypothetical protein
MYSKQSSLEARDEADCSKLTRSWRQPVTYMYTTIIVSKNTHTQKTPQPQKSKEGKDHCKIGYKVCVWGYGGHPNLRSIYVTHRPNQHLFDDQDLVYDGPTNAPSTPPRLAEQTSSSHCSPVARSMDTLTASGSYELCQLCRGISIVQLLATEGYTHHLTLRAWVDSAISCRLCALILYESRRNSNSGHLRGHLYATDAIEDERFLQDRSLRLHWSKGNDVCRAMAVSSSSSTFGPRGHVATEQFHLTSIEIFTDEDDLAATYGAPWWRELPQNTECEASMDVARSWLSQCLHSHQREVVPNDSDSRARAACPTRVASTLYAAARLLQITPSHVLVTPGSEVAEPYATLSYSWGEGPQWPWGPHRIARQSINAMARQGLCRETLPKTISDAVCVTEKLGLRFLWVDALCILQDDLDFLVESVKMGTIYAQGLINISAGYGTDSAAGLFNKRSRSQHHDFSVCIPVDSYLDDKVSRLYFCQRREQQPNFDDPRLPAYLSTGSDAYRVEVDEGPLAQRAWVCQERICSPRTIHFGVTQLFWQCNQATRTEDNLGILESKSPSWTSIEDWKSLFFPMDFNLFTNHVSPTIEDVAKDWRSTVANRWSHEIVSKHYSHRKMTTHSDKLLAIAGLAKRIWQQDKSMRYVAGLWFDSSLPSSLMWYASPGNRRITPYVAPSWSWASLVGKVGFRSNLAAGDEDNMISKCDVVECWVATSDKTDQFSRVLDARLVLETTSFQGRAYQDGSGRRRGNTLELDSVSKLPGSQCHAILDDDRDDDLQVQALLLKEDWEYQWWVMLLVRPKEGESQKFVRVGIGTMSVNLARYPHINLPDLEKKRWTLV